MAADDQERTEQPTGKRRDDFRKKGQVAQSKEVGSAALLTASLLLWYFYGPLFLENLLKLVGSIWLQIHEQPINPSALTHLSIFLVQEMFKLLAPFMLAVMVIGVFSSYIQIGWLFTTKPLEPDLNKFNPINGAKRLVSLRSFVEMIKSIAKVVLVGFVAFRTVSNSFEDSLYLVDLSVFETLRFIAQTAAVVLLKVCLIFIVLGFLDFMYQRWEMEKQMKMTKQEVKEEFKETEGDPQVKGRIRSIQQQMARKRMLAEVPKADVVVTNPTHISVALKYDRSRMASPQVVAKGADLLALRIREIAREHQVPLVENVMVARALHKLELGDSIPAEMFKAVAEILAYVYSMKGTKGR